MKACPMAQIFRDFLATAIYVYTGMVRLCGTDPKRDHGGKVKWGDSSTNAERNSVGMRIHVLGDLGQCLSELQARDATAVLHNLCNEPFPTIIKLTKISLSFKSIDVYSYWVLTKTSENIAFSIYQCFSLFFGDNLGEFFL